MVNKQVLKKTKWDAPRVFWKYSILEKSSLRKNESFGLEYI